MRHSKKGLYRLEVEGKGVDTPEQYRLTALTGLGKKALTSNKPFTTLYKYFLCRELTQGRKAVLAMGVWACFTQNWWSMVGDSWLLSTQPCFTFRPLRKVMT